MGSFRLTLFGLVLALVWCYAQADFLNDRYDNEPNSEEHGVSAGRKRTTCKCGVANRHTGRIVGGKETKPNEYPHMATIVYVGYGEQPFCGGTIISTRHVITAAHCTDDFLPYKGNIAVYVGAHNTNKGYQSKSHQVIPVEEIVQHEYYTKVGNVNDIALLVTGKINFNENVGPACLPTGSENIDGQWVKVTGWGTTRWQGNASPVLKKVNLKVVDLRECSRYYSYGAISVTNPTQFCTYKNYEDSCQGDSGGPLTYLDPETNRYTLVGLVSYGKACASRNPAVNTKVQAFMPWITRHLARKGVGHCQKID